MALLPESSNTAAWLAVHPGRPKSVPSSVLVLCPVALRFPLMLNPVLALLKSSAKSYGQARLLVLLSEAASMLKVTLFWMIAFSDS